MSDDDKLTLLLTITAEQGAPRVPLEIAPSITPKALRQKVSESTKIPLASLKLIFRGRLIGDDDSKEAVKEFKLEKDSVLHCMGKPASSSGGDAAGTSSSAAAVATRPSPPASMPAGSTVSVQSPPAAAAPSVAAAAGGGDPLKLALQMLRASNPPADYQTAVSTLEKILGNIANKPMEEKYRRVKKHNAAFQRRLGGRPGGDAAMIAAGFSAEKDEGGEDVYMLRASAEAWPKLMAAKATVEAAVKDANAANQSVPTPAAVAPANPSLPGMGGVPMPNFGAGGPDMQSAIASLMSDPNRLQAMLQNPMLQQMMRSDPRLANNPMLQQSVEQLASNPAMASQVAQMMGDPNIQRQMQTMMQQQGGLGGGFPGLGGDLGGAGAGGQQQRQQGTNSGGQQQTTPSGGGPDDEDLTEEEMIAEAIRRSLQDGGV